MTPHSPWTRRNSKVHPPLLRQSALDLIGNTPLVRLTRVCEVAGLGYTNSAGRARDGGPACATVRPLQPWTAV